MEGRSERTGRAYRKEYMSLETKWMDMRGGPVKEQIRQAGELLKAGELVAFPTETVYGLGGNALDPEAAGKIYAAKGRPSDNPLIVHIAHADALTAIAGNIPDTAWKLAAAFWPGPLTMILEKKDLVPSRTTGGLSTVAVRMPDHPVALALIEAGGGYIAAPSANLSGRPSTTSAEHVRQDLDGRISAIVDGGDGKIGIESTIIDLTVQPPMILRPGYITQKMLQTVIGPVGMDPGLGSEDPAVRPKAPGMKYRHYAPKAEMKIVEGEADRVNEVICRLAEEALRENRRVGVIACAETAESYRKQIEENSPEGAYLAVRCAGDRNEEISISRHLYGILREFDDLGVDIIFSEAFDSPDLGQAIMNRLLKAAGHQVICA